MKKFLSLFNKKSRIVIGVLSGTSVDGVDTVLLKVRGNGINTKIDVLDFESYPIKKELKEYILKCSSKNTGNAENICKLNFLVGHLFAQSINKLISRNNLLTKDIDLIGSHGQTIYHYPFNQKLFSFNTKSTLQIGDISVISNQTGITTAGDFRTADISVNGDGAPLVPYLDYILFSSRTLNRVLVNIGGISNITFLKRSGKQNDVTAFDSGPGNMMIDYLTKKYFNKKYDKDGRISSKGKINPELFKMICSKDRFYKKNPPKSTGREYYSEKFIEDILRSSGKILPEDIIATFTYFTAYTIYHNVKKFRADELIMSGGGARNKTLMNYIKDLFRNIKVKLMDMNGINPDNKEAVLFAVLANELISGNKTNLPSVSGSDRKVFLGKISIQ
jgi:anhydro-N-acetylmuramic acid kinase